MRSHWHLAQNTGSAIFNFVDQAGDIDFLVSYVNAT